MIKKFLEFVNEGKLNEGMTSYKAGKVKWEINEFIKGVIEDDNGEKVEDFLTDLQNEISLVSGEGKFGDDYFGIEGKTKSGKTILIEQYGRFAGEFGGTTGGKTHTAIFEYDGKDILEEVEKAITKFAGGGVKFFPLWRTEMYGHLIK